jgi:hypothetical protein
MTTTMQIIISIMGRAMTWMTWVVVEAVTHLVAVS